MAQPRDYMLELSQTPPSWAPQFAADCLEHVLPTLRKLNLSPALIDQLHSAILGVRSDTATLYTLADIATRVIAIREGASTVPAFPAKAAALAALARDFAPEPVKEHEWQAERFEEYRKAAAMSQAATPLNMGYFDGRQMASELAIQMLILELEDTPKFSERLRLLKDLAMKDQNVAVAFKRGFGDCIERLTYAGKEE